MRKIICVLIANLFLKGKILFSVTQFGEDEGKVASQSLEALLLSQNRQLQGENSSLRKETIDLNNQFKIIQSRENQLRSQVQNQEALIEKLEKETSSIYFDYK